MSTNVLLTRGTAQKSRLDTYLRAVLMKDTAALTNIFTNTNGALQAALSQLQTFTIPAPDKTTAGDVMTISDDGTAYQLRTPAQTLTLIQAASKVGNIGQDFNANTMTAKKYVIAKSDGTVGGTITVDDSGNVTFASAAGQELFGFKANGDLILPAASDNTYAAMRNDQGMGMTPAWTRMWLQPKDNNPTNSAYATYVAPGDGVMLIHGKYFMSNSVKGVGYQFTLTVSQSRGSTQILSGDIKDGAGFSFRCAFSMAEMFPITVQKGDIVTVNMTTERVIDSTITPNDTSTFVDCELSWSMTYIPSSLVLDPVSYAWIMANSDSDYDYKTGKVG